VFFIDHDEPQLRERQEQGRAGAHHQLRLASGRSAHGALEDLRRPELAEVYRRLVDGRARVRPRQIEALESPIDRITATALYCDQVGLPSDWIDVLRKALERIVGDPEKAGLIPNS